MRSLNFDRDFHRARPGWPHHHGHGEHPPLKMLLLILDWDRREKARDWIIERRLRLYYQCKARGTANSEIISMLGLGDADKMLALCMGPNFVLEPVMRELDRDLRGKTLGRGIACLLPLSGIGHAMMSFFEDSHREERIQKQMEREVGIVKENSDYDLIVAVTNQGYSEELVDSARQAGATGGTVINARRVSDAEFSGFMGLPLQNESEIVTILVRKEKKAEIMRAISRQCGIRSKAHGVIFSVPVEDVAGFAGSGQ